MDHLKDLLAKAGVKLSLPAAVSGRLAAQDACNTDAWDGNESCGGNHCECDACGHQACMGDACTQKACVTYCGYDNDECSGDVCGTTACDHAACLSGVATDQSTNYCGSTVCSGDSCDACY